MSKAILVATIGTRDLMFQTRSGDWYNIGDDQMRGDIIGEQAEVLLDLGQDLTTFRKLTQFLVQHLDQYRSRLCPVITGKLLQDQAQYIQQVFLIGTNQPETVAQRDKDTLYACQILEDWLHHHYPAIAVQIISLGEDGTNPSNFEAMFRWWQSIFWPQLVKADSDAPIWLCIKGGVGQTSESGRISGLSRFGDRIQFFEFQQTPQQNRQGIPSDYSGPFVGTVYLWDRAQQQALKLLERYDYAGVEELLAPYIQQNASQFGAVPTWLKASMAWNRGEFQTFFNQAKSTLPPAAQRQGEQWWWMAYEQAQLAVIRLAQENTTEAMLHSFRAIEGIIWEWMEIHIPEHLDHPPRRYPQLLDTILVRYPALKHQFIQPRTGERLSSVNLNAYIQQAVIETALPQVAQNDDIRAFWQETRERRNALSHRLGGLSPKDLYRAWGPKIRTPEQWQNRLLACLNVLSGQSFKSFYQASLMCQVHRRLQDAVVNYQP